MINIVIKVYTTTEEKLKYFYANKMTLKHSQFEFHHIAQWDKNKNKRSYFSLLRNMFVCFLGVTTNCGCIFTAL
jgi:hypothetical protein